MTHVAGSGGARERSRLRLPAWEIVVAKGPRQQRTHPPATSRTHYATSPCNSSVTLAPLVRDTRRSSVASMGCHRRHTSYGRMVSCSTTPDTNATSGRLREFVWVGGCVAAPAAWASGPSDLVLREPWGRRCREARGPARSRERPWGLRSVHRSAKMASRSRFVPFVYTVALLWTDVGT